MSSDPAATTKAFTDEHLSEAFFTTALTHGLRTAVQIGELHLSAGTAVGDNFCSDIYRAQVRYRRADDANDAPDETVSLIVKAMPFSEARTPLLVDLEVFDKEVSMYMNTLPRMEQLLDGERLSARCFYAVKEPIQIIVFEDLRAAGFRMADRTAGLDEAHTELVMRKLGRFHAASMRLVEQVGERAMQQYNFGIIKPNAGPNPVMNAVMVGGIDAVAELVGTWPGMEAAAKKLDGIRVDFLRKIDRVCNEQQPLYRVLNHGDMWVNNMLFKYSDDGRPVDVCFVDYQMSVYDSPGHDLNYFLNTSPALEVREQRREHVVGVYLKAFEQTLVCLKSAAVGRWGLAELRTECRARELYGLMAAVGILPIVLMSRDATATLAALTDDAEKERMKRARFYNPNFVAAIRAIVQRFDETGALDRVPEV